MRPEQLLIGVSERGSWRRRRDHYAAFIHVMTTKTGVCRSEGVSDEMGDMGVECPSVQMDPWLHCGRWICQ